jgi:hypothetical protein
MFEYIYVYFRIYSLTSIGILHGVAGPGAILGVLPAVEMQSWRASTCYLGIYIKGCVFDFQFKYRYNTDHSFCKLTSNLFQQTLLSLHR